MGFALPAAIGAKMARPDAEVWVVAGDGGFQMTLCELATLQQEKLRHQDRGHQQRLPGHGPPVAGVLLRQALRRHADALARLRDAGRRLRHRGPSRVTTRAECVPAVAGGARLAASGALIDFRVEQEESVYPMVPAGADLARHDPPAGAPGGRGGRRMKHTLVARVQNQPGVLNRVSQPVPAARLQHRQPDRRRQRDARLLAHDDRGRHRARPARAGGGQPAQAGAACWRSSDVTERAHGGCATWPSSACAAMPRPQRPRSRTSSTSSAARVVDVAPDSRDRRGHGRPRRRWTAWWTCSSPRGSSRWCARARWPWCAAGTRVDAAQRVDRRGRRRHRRLQRLTGELEMAPSIYYDSDADLERPRRAAGRHHRLRQPGPRPRAEPARQRGGRHRRGSPEGSRSRAKAQADGLDVATPSPRPPTGPTSS